MASLGSLERVRLAAEKAGLPVEIRRMGESTRTAQEAADQCGCDVAQIVKSLIFRGADDSRLHLFLVSGSRQLDLDKAAALAGQKLKRGDPRHIREETGFAIGGVSPLGYERPLPVFGDESLLAFDVVWAAAGAHDAVFAADPKALFKAAGATAADITPG